MFSTLFNTNFSFSSYIILFACFQLRPVNFFCRLVKGYIKETAKPLVSERDSIVACKNSKDYDQTAQNVRSDLGSTLLQELFK